MSALDLVPWKNRMQGEPLDLCSAQLFESWCGGVDTCLVCRKKNVDCYEVTFEWGDTKVYEYFREMCCACLKTVFKQCRNHKDGKDYS